MVNFICQLDWIQDTQISANTLFLNVPSGLSQKRSACESRGISAFPSSVCVGIIWSVGPEQNELEGGFVPLPDWPHLSPASICHQHPWLTGLQTLMGIYTQGCQLSGLQTAPPAFWGSPAAGWWHALGLLSLHSHVSQDLTHGSVWTQTHAPWLCCPGEP